MPAPAEPPPVPPWRFRRVSELLLDLRGELLGLSDAAGPLLREVVMGRASRPEQALERLAACAGEPAALLVPGPVELPRAPARNQREVRVLLYLRGRWRPDRPDLPDAIHDLADHLCEHFLPQAPHPQHPRLLAGVAWEPLGWEPLAPANGPPVLLIRLLARDFRGPR